MVGAGSWELNIIYGSSGYGHEVRIWGNKAEQIHEINEKHTNETYLPGIQLSKTIKGYESLAEAMDGIDTILLVVPTKSIRSVMQQLKDIVKQPITIIHASKGIEPGSFKRISEMIEEEMPKELIESVIVL